MYGSGIENNMIFKYNGFSTSRFLLIQPKIISKGNSVPNATITLKDIKVILDLEISRVQERVEARKIKLTVAPKAKEFLTQKGFDKAYGARQLRRSVERHLEDPMAEAILRGEIEAGKPVSVRAGKGKLNFIQ